MIPINGLRQAASRNNRGNANSLLSRTPKQFSLTVIGWPAPGSEDTELGVLMEPEVGHGETEVYARVQA